MDSSKQKQKLLDSVAQGNGWRHVLIEKDRPPDEVPPVFVHELYGDGNSLSWTVESVDISSGRQFMRNTCQEICNMLDDGVVFTEAELWQFNIDQTSDKQKLADYLTHEEESVRKMAEQRYKELFPNEV